MESELLALLQNAKPNRDKLDELIKVLEAAASIDLSDVEQQQQLEGVWELRWSSSKQPYLQVQPWLENLQVLMPSQGRGMNLLRLPPPLAVAGVAVEAESQPVGAALMLAYRLLAGDMGERKRTGTSTRWLESECDDGHPTKPSAMSCGFAAGKTAPFFVCANGTTYPPKPCSLLSPNHELVKEAAAVTARSFQSGSTTSAFSKS